VTTDTGTDISFFLERNPSKFVISYFEMNSLSLLELKSAFPGEWILLGNPVMDESGLELLSGIPLFHSKDKKEVCYIGREKTAGFDKITLIFTGSFRPSRKITGIFNRVKG
jgi:hypothetical protein